MLKGRLDGQGLTWLFYLPTQPHTHFLSMSMCISLLHITCVHVFVSITVYFYCIIKCVYVLHVYKLHVYVTKCSALSYANKRYINTPVQVQWRSPPYHIADLFYSRQISRKSWRHALWCYRYIEMCIEVTKQYIIYIYLNGELTIT